MVAIRATVSDGSAYQDRMDHSNHLDMQQRP